MPGSMTAAKVKISITLSRELLERIDAEVEAREGATRSSVIEAWLRRGRRAQAATALRDETVRYYESLDEGERADDEAIARAASRKSRTVRYD